MKLKFRIIILIIFFFKSAYSIEIERFEHIDSKQGLSQNQVLSAFCDSKGFLWFGTFDGLNRYDGYNFKVYKSEEGRENTLTNNRIIKIWEDSLKFIWVETYEGYYHYFIPTQEEFITYPDYLKSLEEKNSIINCFFQASKNEIWLGSSNSGAYYLSYNKNGNLYDFQQFLSRGISSISNNSVNFITNDKDKNIWIGTNKGLNYLLKTDLINSNPSFKHYFANYHFTSAVQIKKYIYFGTKNSGIVIYDQQSKLFTELDTTLNILKNTEIKELQRHEDKSMLISTSSNGIYIYDTQSKTLHNFNQYGKNIISVYTDHDNMIWVNTENFGIIRINPKTYESKHYILTPEELQPIVDDERLYLYEDRKGDLWIGTHGAGLALYNRSRDRFKFYRNVPNMPGTISSNFVHCIVEDQSGLLWVGTGQFNGGINKIVRANTAFKQIIPKTKVDKLSDNVIRNIFQDSNGYIWMSTKSGEIYIYYPDLSFYTVLTNIITGNKVSPGFNIYTIMEDKDGYIWMGSKGGGILVSIDPIKKIKRNYNNVMFNHYPNVLSDTNSLSSNFVYSIIQDIDDNIWISTYGGGLNKVLNRNREKLICKKFTTTNSNISSDDVRYLLEDSEGNIWIATTFGLNLLTENEKNKIHPNFESYLFNPQNPKSISYNDVIHIFEDSKKRIWLGTFGGGLNLINKDSLNQISFKHYNTANGLINDVVFSILEDRYGKIWLSTEKGVSLLNPNNETFENYDINSGLFAKNFNENTGIRTINDNILFGSIDGTLVISPDKLKKSQYTPPVVITNFQLSNRDVDFRDKNSPIKSSVETLNSINLKYFQSSFSFEYAALSYFAPNQNQYMFMLENFDNDWNEVGNQRKATYTNIPPGKYIFKVRGANWDGTWNETPVVININITPPWWKSKPAYLVYFFLSIIILFTARRIFLNYYKLHNDLLIERRVNEIKLQFFTNISHEIRTPLTLILGPIEDIKAIKHIPSQLIERIEIMERNAKRMLRLVNQLLDFRKIQKEKMSLNVRETDLVKFTKEIAEHFNPIAKQKKINFIFDSSLKKLNVFIDTRKFDSVVFNVLSNAFKYTSKGKTIKLEIKKENNEYVDIIIIDEGPGIAKDKLNVLFQRFTTLNTSSDAFEGSGIGLNLSYEIMKLHKGDITVESKPNKGSKFTIKLPLGFSHFKPEDFATKETTSIKHHEVIEEFSENNVELSDVINEADKKKVLIVEDNLEIIVYLKNILKNQYEIKSANNGKESLKILTTFHPDVIITDIMMPEMDGIEFTKHIKNEINFSHIPVIMLTAKSTIEDQIIGVESGAESYILKPFNANLLKAVVDNILKQRENILEKYSSKGYTDNIEVKVTKKDDEFMQNVVKIIDKNYNDPEFNVEKLVEISSVSRTLLYNKLKGLTGLSPVEFIRQMRLKYAAVILKETGRGVSETAYLTGFNDIKYFRKCFKDMFRMSPKEFKEKLPE